MSIKPLITEVRKLIKLMERPFMAEKKKKEKKKEEKQKT